ncbi:rhamnan synthesis F family protein [Ningiella sp. W23]|uniref:rhamnan synthesis F family protein n=1 Tax=Ningiella sp. W23 TaxID=3023715 RepID=UPI003757EDAC
MKKPSRFGLFKKRQRSASEGKGTLNQATENEDVDRLAKIGSDPLEATVITPYLKNYVKHFKLAIAEALFDPEYYQERYGRFESDLAAFADYIDKSSFANINPSAAFDSESYLRRNLDVYHSQTSPLMHYLHHGKDDNRTINNEIVRWRPKDVLLAKETQTWQEQRIALVFHIFYEDAIEKLIVSTRLMPISVDVFITAASEEIAKKAEIAFESVEQCNKLRVVSVPNRGRNFGPFLVEFSDELLEYDLFCHIHSKKSLYSGREQTQWFDYLHQYLMKDTHTISCLLRLFDEHQDLGMYYPTSFWMMPSWVNHWTCNKVHAAPFVESFGLDIDSDFVNYPVGGMFWARPKALAPLLEASYQYEDFPEEPLPNDGSYLHALERILGVLTEKQGFKQFFYYPPESKFTCDKTYIYINYMKSPGQFLSEISNFEIVSFDVFDTLITRQYVAPDHAKYLLGEYLTQLDVVASPEVFVGLRNDTETDIRISRNHVGDVKLCEVYDALAQQLGCDIEQAREWEELEFQYDLHSMNGKTDIIQIVNRLSDMQREIWLVTDTYYSEEQISTILRHCGLAVSFRLFVSSELGLRKDNTSMWKEIRRLVDESGKSFIHIGDNVRSDAQLCGDFGLVNMHILHPKDKWLAAGLGPNAVTQGENVKRENMKWGALMSKFGRYPFFGN